MLVFQESRLWDGDWTMGNLSGSVLKMNSYGGNKGSKTEWRRNLGCDAVPTMPQLIPWGALECQ